MISLAVGLAPGRAAKRLSLPIDRAEGAEPQITGDGLLMLGDHRLPFAVEFDQPYIKPQLRRAEASQCLEELEGLLLREAIEEPDEGDLVGKVKPVMRAPALAELYEIFLGQAGDALELVAGKHLPV